VAAGVEASRRARGHWRRRVSPAAARPGLRTVVRDAGWSACAVVCVCGGGGVGGGHKKVGPRRTRASVEAAASGHEVAVGAPEAEEVAS
jgi:hypothetical protein